MIVDYYAVLNLSPSCSAREVRDAYKHLALLYHPDRADESYAANFRAVKDAYDVLCDPARRYLYDLGYNEMRRMRQRQEEENLARMHPTRLPHPLQHQHQQPLQSSLYQQYQQQQTSPVQRPHSRRDLPPPLNPTRRVSSAASSTRSLHTPLSASQRTLTPAAAAVEYHSSIDIRGSPTLTGTSGKNVAPPTPIPMATSMPTATPPQQPPRNQRPQPQQYGRNLSQPNQHQYNNCTGSGISSVLIPKKTTLQWGGEIPRSRRVLALPKEESVSASVTKTWRVFFHLHDIGMERK
ncbi:DnaJ domain [Trypanosoma melophagium]|uniref:DnaJ domain n=1 Tax=Trypanosoma melophagium TaxID=715481 RepID=UPI003519EF93|nr:DnaJ domain [Trypanosoma melophagium]